jgi:RimJ/RimL family protein N-acetyltransferase
VTYQSNSLAPQTVSAGELHLRPFALADEPDVAAALQDADVLRWVAGRAVIEAPEAERARRWLEPRIDGWANGSAVFAVADAAHGTLYGSVSIRDVGRLPDQAVMAYWVTPEHRGRGIAHRALDAAARWAFTSAEEGGLGLHRLTLDHALVNVASCRTATKAGFRIEGTMRDFYAELTGRRHDSHLHARLATD